MTRFQDDPKEYHYAVVKRIFKYLKGIFDYGIWYDRSNDFSLCAYTNADWECRMDNRKSTSGGAFFLKEDWFLGRARNNTLFHKL